MIIESIQIVYEDRVIAELMDQCGYLTWRGWDGIAWLYDLTLEEQMALFNLVRGKDMGDAQFRGIALAALKIRVVL
jgi:hypothetical protein